MDNTLFIVDATYQCHRAFYAIPQQLGGDGKPNNMVHGIFNFIRNLYGRGARYVAMCFDSRQKGFREKSFTEYKANRSDKDPSLTMQIEDCKTACSFLGLPVWEVPGFEADDIIASLTKSTSSAGYNTVIVANDKDFYQLLDDNVRVWETKKKQQVREVGPQQVFDDFGVKPEQMLIYQALVGDSADNIKGVPGVGPKTAVKLIGSHTNPIDFLASCGHKKVKAHNWDFVQAHYLCRLRDNLPGVSIGNNIRTQAPIPFAKELRPWLELKNIKWMLDNLDSVRLNPDATVVEMWKRGG